MSNSGESKVKRKSSNGNNSSNANQTSPSPSENLSPKRSRTSIIHRIYPRKHSTGSPEIEGADEAASPKPSAKKERKSKKFLKHSNDSTKSVNKKRHSIFIMGGGGFSSSHGSADVEASIVPSSKPRKIKQKNSQNYSIDILPMPASPVNSIGNKGQTRPNASDFTLENIKNHKMSTSFERMTSSSDVLSHSWTSAQSSPRLTERVKMPAPIKFLRRSLTHKEDTDIIGGSPSVAPHPSSNNVISGSSSERTLQNPVRKLSPSEQIVEEGRALLTTGDTVVAKERFEQSIDLLQQEGAALVAQPSLRYAFACARYFLGYSLFKQSQLGAAEFQIRESLDLIDEIILDRCFKDISSRYIPEDWILGCDITLEMLWLRKSDVEYLLALVIKMQKEPTIALEWFQKSVLSRERANYPARAACHSNIAFVITQYVSLEVDSLVAFIDTHRDKCILLLTEFMELLHEAKVNARQAIKLCKSDTFVLLEANTSLLEVLNHMMKVYLFEINCGVKRTNSANYVKRLNQNIDKIRKETGRLQRKLGKLPNHMGLPDASQGGYSADSNSRHNNSDISLPSRQSELPLLISSSQLHLPRAQSADSNSNSALVRPRLESSTSLNRLLDHPSNPNSTRGMRVSLPRPTNAS